jgi:predicted DNA-binding transcriptional regulator AlpA
MTQLLSKKDVRSLITLSFAQIDRMEAEGKFPKRRHLGFRVVWVAAEVEQWIQERIVT